MNNEDEVSAACRARKIKNIMTDEFVECLNLSQILRQTLGVHLDPRHGLKRLRHVVKPFIDQTKHFMSLFQFRANVGMVNERRGNGLR